MSEQTLYINVRPLWARVPLALLALLALGASWYALRWGLGDTMAEYAPVSYANDPAVAFETAEAAARLAPEDPLAHMTLARLYRYGFDPKDVPRALAEYDRAMALAPNDYMVWTEAGRARASLGDIEGGVATLRRAVELAPNYAEPRWHLGNALLRAGDTEEAFAELRRAADADPQKFRPQVYNLAWQVYGPEMSRVVEAVGRTPEARAQLVGVLIGRTRLDDALAVWDTLSAEQKREQAGAGDELARALNAKGQHKRALQVLAESGAQDVSPERVSNGGFESEIGQPGKHLYGWQVTQAAGVQAAVDARTAHGGNRSLRLLFNVPGHSDFRNVLQLIAVEPSTRYRLSYFARTGELNSAATLFAVASDAANESQVFGRSDALPTGTHDWQQFGFDFTTGPKTEAVVVRLARVGCPEQSCPIYGKIWYDDFDLRRADAR